MSSPPATELEESPLDAIIREVDRFRILVIGRSGVGKSSLINHVFRIKIAPVEDHKAGDAKIDNEFTSEENKLFVLHDSKGFEPGQLENFDIVRRFVEERSEKPLLKDRVHGIWLCVDTPTAGGRVFETGDEKLLQFAQDKDVPLVLVFTQYDRLERTKEFQLRGNKDMDPTSRRRQIIEDAEKAFEACLRSLNLKPGTRKPKYAKVSVRKGYEKYVSSLAETTGDICKERVKGDAWVMWSMAQRANLPVKIEACIAKGVSQYIQGLQVASSLPFFGQWILRDCLEKVHKDIITCWNFKDEGEVLISREFQDWMIRLVDAVKTELSAPDPPNIDEASKFVALASNASKSFVPVVAGLGVAALSARWLSITLGQNFSEARRLLIAYIVDLVKVLMELFNITLRVDLAFKTSWKELHGAFESYQSTRSCQEIHESIRSKKRSTVDNWNVGSEIRQLLKVDKHYTSGS
ncbi:hypothetical protein EI94DRAFT_1757749 [Lactarius quietus]|nr:hypothetical protein EI94DRAFT_1757749 [Lactarius quietus]